MLNKADGVVVYINNLVNDTTHTLDYGSLRILNSKIKIDDSIVIEISSIYRSHDLSKRDFIYNMNKFFQDYKKIKNHLIVGDFNMNLLDLDTVNQEFLTSLYEYGFKQSFKGITRPSIGLKSGSCIDNIFIKTDILDDNAIKILNSFTDHYPLLLILKNNKAEVDIVTDYWILNYSKLKKLVSKINWNEILLYDPNLTTKLIID